VHFQRDRTGTAGESPDRRPGDIAADAGVFGGTGGADGGVGIVAGGIRVTFWGALAMGVTAGVGALFGTVV